MRKSSFAIFVLSVLVPFAVIAGTESACEMSCCRQELAEGKPVPDKSIYQLPSTWTNDLGKQVQLKELQGRPQVVTMFFANCPIACPILVHEMKAIEASLPAEVRGKVGFTLVSFDTERDTPEALRRYREANDLSKDRWTLLRGSPEAVLELAAVLGVNYKKDAQGQFAHSNLITLLNDKGEVVWQKSGLSQDCAEWKEHVANLVQDE